MLHSNGEAWGEKNRERNRQAQRRAQKVCDCREESRVRRGNIKLLKEDVYMNKVQIQLYVL